ncbi:MAG: hypothetical protein KatS3mg108_3162 [Isosphaeraceae bacterium]|jgi:glycosyltransferase involved in cell wall biosynthesis|nr:MAG: hypothetical protein KatS3mg108_3162 [Isosphaeraceae bacterium]
MTRISTIRSDRTTRPGCSALGVLHLCNGLDPKRDGGMVPSILGFTGGLARAGETVTIVTPTPSRLEPSEVPPGVELIGPDPDFADWIAKADLVHIHGLWQAHSRRGAPTAHRQGIPYLIAAHGMADPWALRHKAWKKAVYSWLVEGRNLRGASCLHALAEPEVGHLRTLAPQTPIALVPNGVDLRPFDHLPDRLRLEQRHPELAGRLVVLFLGRLHRKKGLDLLGEAFAALAPRFPELHLLVAGRDEGARIDLASRAEAAGLADRITWLDHVSGESAREAWGAADAFILPSYSEGFSMAVLEALAARKPTVITTACHFGELARHGGGLVVEPDPESVTAGLRQLLEMTPAERAAMAARGRRLIEQHYTWDHQAARLQEVYRWLIGGGPAPECVVERGKARPVSQACRSTSRPVHEPSGADKSGVHQPQGRPAPVSVIVPVKNEAENLRRCLPSLAWADEVFVVDSQSDDATAEVAAEHGACVVQFYFNGHYPKKKNWALDNLPLRNDWVLIVDADEVVPPELAEEIRRRIALDEADGYYLNMKYYFLGRRIRHCGYSECWNLRLFRHALGRYEAIPAAPGSTAGDNEAHEHVELVGRVLRLKHELEHYAYPTVTAFVEKHNRYATWEAENYERFLREPVPAGIGAGKRFKRRLKKLFLRLPCRPLLRFLYSYVIRLGFLDGRAGLSFCLLLSYYEFLCGLKRYEMASQPRPAR